MSQENRLPDSNLNNVAKSGAERPFDKSYVLRTTIKHMQKSVDTSISKTLDRLPEFATNPEKSLEVFETLTYLHALKKHIHGFQHQNPKQFEGE